MEKVGYARVSTAGQDLETQIEQLQAAGCTKVFQEKESGAKTGRPQLKAAKEYMRKGDKLVVTKLDRLARSVLDLHKTVRDLKEREIEVEFLKENIDFGTPSGKLMFTMLGAIAEFEREIINERTSEGRERAISKGKHMGRPSQPKQQIKRAMALYNERESNGMSVNDIVKLTGVPRSTIYSEAKKEKKD